MCGDFARGKDTALPTWLTDWVEEAYVEIPDMCQSLDVHSPPKHHIQSTLSSPLSPSSMYLLVQGTISTYMSELSYSITIFLHTSFLYVIKGPKDYYQNDANKEWTF